MDRVRYCSHCLSADLVQRKAAAAAKRAVNPSGKVCKGCSKPADWSTRSHYCPGCREAARVAGLCTRCGVNQLPEGRRFCGGCQEKDIKKQKERQAANQSAGLCRCGTEPLDGQKECAACRSRALTGLRRYRSQAVAAGKCNHCLRSPARPDRTLCEPCDEAASLRLRVLRLRALAGYGSTCSCCGETRERFLEIDHVSRSWTGQRPSSEVGSTLFARLAEEGFPSGYQVLCINCNWSKHTGQACTLRHDAEEPPAWGSYIQSASTAAGRSALRLRIAALAAYGDRCACCEEKDLQVLNLDHVNGGGSAERRSVGGNATALYRDLKRREWPAGYRVLCLACNKSFHWLGRCPHQDPALGLDVAAALAALTGTDAQLPDVAANLSVSGAHACLTPSPVRAQ